MANHPNRGKIIPASNPTAKEIREAREAAGLTQTEAALLIHCSLGAWNKWEIDGEQGRRMHPALFALFRLRTLSAADRREAFAAWWDDRQPRADDPIAWVAEEAWMASLERIIGPALK